MIEVYDNVTGMDSMLHLSTAATVRFAIQIDGGSSLTNVLDIDDTTGCVNVASTGNDAWVPNNKGTFTQQGQFEDFNWRRYILHSLRNSSIVLLELIWSIYSVSLGRVVILPAQEPKQIIKITN